MVGYDHSNEDEATEMAVECFLSIRSAAEEKNIEKTAVVFYDIVKRTYAMAELEGLLEKDKEKINSALKVTQVLTMMGLKTEDWSDEMIEEFNNRVKELWVID